MTSQLLDEGANIHIFDPMIKERQILNDLISLWKYNGEKKSIIKEKLKKVRVHNDYFKCILNSYAIAILTEWDQFNSFDWIAIEKNIKKPIRIFDGRNFLKLKKLAVNYIGK